MAPASRRPAAADQTASTADPDEIARFAAMAEAWWDEDGDFRPLHAINRVRIAYLRDRAAQHFGRDPMAPKPLDGLSLLDVGCGGGLLSEPMRRLGAAVTAIDAGEENLRVAAVHAERSGLDIDFRQATPEVLAAEGRNFDIVLNMEVIEHVPDMEAFLAACCRLVAPGGMMALSTLNRTVKSLALAKIGAEYLLRWLPAGTHDWRRFVKPSELVAGLRRHGMEIADLTGISFNPLSGDWSPSRDLSVNYMACTVRRD